MTERAAPYCLLPCLLLGLLSCADGDGAEDTTPRRSATSAGGTTADLFTLVPEGADLLVRVDLRRLRRFWRARPWSQGVQDTDRVAERLDKTLGSALLRRADVLVAALWFQTESAPAQLLLIARGRRTEGPGLAQLARKRIDGGGPAAPRRPPRGKGAPAAKRPRWGRYRGVDLIERQGAATALLSPYSVVSGPSLLVRQAVDLQQAVPGRASAREDRVLMALWKLVAGARAGKAPLLAAVVHLPAAARRRLTRLYKLPGPVHRAGLRVSGGSWMTARAFVDVAGRAAARGMIEALQRHVQRLVGSRLGQKLGLARLLSPLAVHHEGGRIYLQWALPVGRLDGYVAPVLRLLRRRPPPRP
ncbi:MAG: hypothetical protein ABI333_21355 [bacterium]